ncbi:MAG: hypothetical protein CVV44_21710 [Spirochaetae bacterium HGW-Spirochaetae-1]|jgi:NRPS condensation-like uncharacterized protein|nr:MAG: hypothetical protein CVV44_21710 [Spirochaetae bacterium HGW-Spirochaetae-1]
MNGKNATETKETVARKLGGLERYHLMLQNFLHTNVVVHARVAGHITEDMLRRPLDLLQKRHPLMTVRIDRRRSGPRFMSGGVPAIPLRVISLPEESWHTVAESELNTPLPIDRGPLLRCVLATHGNSRSTILITYSHTIGDGMAGAGMMRDLLAFINDETIMDIQPLILKKKMEAYFPRKTRGIPGALAYMKINHHYMKHLRESGGSIMPEYDGQAPLHERWIQIVPRQIDGTTVKKLSEKARSEGTTVNSALTAAHLMALAHDLDHRKPVSMALMSAVNLRNILSGAADGDMGNFAGSCNTVHRVDIRGSLWELAREHRSDLLESIEAREPMLHLLGLNLYDGIIRWIGHDNFAARSLDRFYAGFKQKMTIVSNMGRIDMGTTRSNLNIESLGFASSSRASGMIYSIIAMTDRCMTWNFVATDPLYSRKHLESIADHAVSLILNTID